MHHPTSIGSNFAANKMSHHSTRRKFVWGIDCAGFTLPEFKQDFGERHSLTRSEAKIQMDRIYEKIIKRYLLTKYDAYRTYKVKNMKSIRVVLFDI